MMRIPIITCLHGVYAWVEDHYSKPNYPQKFCPQIFNYLGAEPKKCQLCHLESLPHRESMWHCCTSMMGPIPGQLPPCGHQPHVVLTLRYLLSLPPGILFPQYLPDSFLPVYNAALMNRSKFLSTKTIPSMLFRLHPHSSPLNSKWHLSQFSAHLCTSVKV